MRRFAIAIILISVNFGEYFILMDIIIAKRQIVFPFLFREQFGNLFRSVRALLKRRQSLETTNVLKLFIIPNWRQTIFMEERNFSVALECAFSPAKGKKLFF